jgi:hypothetical protein
MIAKNVFLSHIFFILYSTGILVLFSLMRHWHYMYYGCMNFACPLHKTGIVAEKQFFEITPTVKKGWANQKSEP